MENQTDLIKQRKELMPQEVRDLIEMNVVSDVVAEVRNNYGLTKRQAVLLENEIILVLMFFLPHKGLIDRITESLEINYSLAERISLYLQTEIFDLVEEYLLTVDKYFSGTNESAVQTYEEVKPLRTMDDDAKNIHGYGAYSKIAEDDEPVHSSSQDSVIKKNRRAE